MQEINNSNNKIDNDTIDVREIINKSLKKWYFFFISVVICVGLAVLYYFSTTPKFMVSSTIMIRDAEEGLGDMLPSGLSSMMNIGSGGTVEDELEIINSRSVMYQTIKNTDTQTEYRFKKGLRWVEQYPQPAILVIYEPYFVDTTHWVVSMELKSKKNGYVLDVEWGEDYESHHKFASLDESIETCFGVVRFQQNRSFGIGDKMRVKTVPMPVLVDLKRNAISAKQVKKESAVVNISTTSDCSIKAMRMINEMVRLYNESAIEYKNLMAANTKMFIEERLRVIAFELDSIEQKLELYKKQNKITNITAEAELILTGETEYQKQKVDIATQISLLDYVNDILNDENAFSMIPANLGFTDAALVALIGSYNEMVLQRMRVQRTATGDNPMLAILDEQLVTMRANIVKSIKNVKDGLLITMEKVEQEEQKLTDRIESVPERQREFLRLVREQNIKQEIYLFLCQKIEESNITISSTMVPAKTIDKAQPSPEQVAPRKKIILLFALMMGLIIPIGGMYLYSIWNNTIADRKEYERLVRVPFLGQLLQSKQNKFVVVTNNEHSIASELFRLLRTNIRFMLPSLQTSNVVLVTSSVPGEGKSFIAVNLAVSFAMLGKKTCIVGLDIRKPMLAKYMGLPNNGALTSFLADTAYSLEDIVMSSGVHEMLDVIPTGMIPPNPNELLQSERVDELFALLRDKYDYIVVDTAPIAVVSDTFLLNRISDMTIYVSRVNYTTREMVDFINTVHGTKRLKNMACVLNGVEAVNVGYGYGLGYGYGS